MFSRSNSAAVWVLSVRWLVDDFGPERNISTTVEYIDIHDPQMMYPNDFGPLTFYVVPPRG